MLTFVCLKKVGLVYSRGGAGAGAAEAAFKFSPRSRIKIFTRSRSRNNIFTRSRIKMVRLRNAGFPRSVVINFLLALFNKYR
jgi:hypothetical protein